VVGALRPVLPALAPDPRHQDLATASYNFPLACPGLLGTWLSGGRMVMLGSPDPAAAFAAIEAESVTITAAVPAVTQRWLAYAALTTIRAAMATVGVARFKWPERLELPVTKVGKLDKKALRDLLTRG
jgi:non-ribosomal peptide synthetase component E (peptide arylation enzyme)